MATPRKGSWLSRLLMAWLLTWDFNVQAYDLDPTSLESVKTISKSMAINMLSFYPAYTTGEDPGLVPKPYYWWEAGAMLGSLIEYWYTTGDKTFVNLTQAGLLAQVGENNDYMPKAQNLDEGNDDQGFWGLAVMSAAEYNFPNPSPKEPQWLALAQAVFNTQAARWEPANCGGGLRWQIYQWNNGYNYKNSISNACFFALGARLAVYTGNHSYADWAAKTWDWMYGVKFINSESYYVYDGAQISDNCTTLTPYQWTYNAGGMILGAAAMWNFTEDQVWKDRLDNLLNGSKVFFPKNDIMEEVACESVHLCDTDALSFKAYLSRWFAAITKWAPWTYDFVIPYLKASAVAAAKQCTGGKNGQMCGLIWNNGSWDGTTGLGQQMAAMEVTIATMVRERGTALTSSSGGTSQGNAGAGSSDQGRTKPKTHGPVTTGDRAGAAILTVIVVFGSVAGFAWLLVDEGSEKSPLEQFRGFHSSAQASLTALAVSGGIAPAALKAKHARNQFDEKSGGAVAAATRTPGSRTSSEIDPQTPQPILVGRVRSTASGETQRRMSNMPRGWPYNPSLRGSALIEPEPQRPQSVFGGHSDSNRLSSQESSHSDSITEEEPNEKQSTST